MPFVASCCPSKSINNNNIIAALKMDATLYGNIKNTRQENEQQVTSFVPTVVLQKKCYAIDRSTAAQESAINQNFKNAEQTKEFICDYFDISQYNFTQIICNGITFKVLGCNPLFSCSINGIKYFAPRGKYFVGILSGVIKL